MRYYNLNELFDNIKKYPEDKILLESYPKMLTFEFKSSRKCWSIGLNCVKVNLELFLDICDYIKLTYEEKIIKNIIE